MLTTEQVLKMDRAQLCAHNSQEIQNVLGEHYGSDDAVICHITEVLSSSTTPYVKAVHEAFERQGDLTSIIPVFEKEPAMVQLWTWRELTNVGIDQIDYAKFVHKHLARSILKLFGTPLT
jgi:hypothetical protein